MYYELHDRSIDKEKFWSYCLALKKKMGKRPWVLYLDNLRVHTSEDSVKFLDKEGIPCIWAPLYSPEYNPIELYFSQLKHWVKKARLRGMLQKQPVDYQALVAEAVAKIPRETIDK